MSQRTTSHLRARELQLSRGGRVLLTGIDLTLVPGTVLAVVGENGRGKTTLLDALAGTLEPDAGTVERHGALGMVRQELTTADAAGPRTVGGLLDAPLARPLAAAREHDAAADALADGTAEAARRYDDALARVTALDAWDAPRRLEVALEEVGAVTERERELTALSVGQRYRVRLAGVIAARDEILAARRAHQPPRREGARAPHAGTARAPRRGRPGLPRPGALEDVATSVLDLDPTEDGRPLLVGGGLADWEQARRRARTAWEDAYRAQQEEQRSPPGGSRCGPLAPVDRMATRQGHRQAPAAVPHTRHRPRPERPARPARGAPPGRAAPAAAAVAAGLRHARRDPAAARRWRAGGPGRSGPGRSGLGLWGLRRCRFRRCGTGTGPAGPAPAARDDSAPRGRGPALVVGPNGAGKTSLLRVLAGDLAPDAGAVRVLGRARLALLAQEDERQEPRRGDPGGAAPPGPVAALLRAARRLAPGRAHQPPRHQRCGRSAGGARAHPVGRGRRQP
ncbi:ATP-binding cassette domain-containing protein [Brachybacterium sp. GPGPB12]|uniref:ATP-binding cassette domain-containing protein n=1 Tax=Brachybacterium sp. GPGPB12 TaxID=3023517 RepID=UPI0031342FE6